MFVSLFISIFGVYSATWSIYQELHILFLDIKCVCDISFYYSFNSYFTVYKSLSLFVVYWNFTNLYDFHSSSLLALFWNLAYINLIVWDDKDPPWFNKFKKKLLHIRFIAYNPDLIYRLQFLQERLCTFIESSKERHYARIANRLSNTQKSTKLTGFC